MSASAIRMIIYMRLTKTALLGITTVCYLLLYYRYKYYSIRFYR